MNRQVVAGWKGEYLPHLDSLSLQQNQYFATVGHGLWISCQRCGLLLFHTRLGVMKWGWAARVYDRVRHGFAADRTSIVCDKHASYHNCSWVLIRASLRPSGVNQPMIPVLVVKAKTGSGCLALSIQKHPGCQGSCSLASGERNNGLQ